MPTLKEKIEILKMRENVTKQTLGMLIGYNYVTLYRRLEVEKLTNNQILTIANRYGYSVELIISDGEKKLTRLLPSSDEPFDLEKMNEKLGMEVSIDFVKDGRRI